jgi:hypothetical protein
MYREVNVASIEPSEASSEASKKLERSASINAHTERRTASGASERQRLLLELPEFVTKFVGGAVVDRQRCRPQAL